MTAPERIWVNLDDNEDGCCPVESDISDAHKFFNPTTATEYILAASPEVQALIAEAEARGMDRAGLHVQAYVKRGIGNGEIQGWNAASDLEAAIRSEAAAIRAAIGGVE